MRLLDAAIAVAIMALWGVNFAVAKLGLAEMPPILFVTLRFIIVSIMLVPFVPVPHGRWRDIGILALVFGGIHFPLMFSGMALVDAAVSSILVQIQVPAAAALAAIFLGDKIGWRRMTGMAVSILGVAILAGAPTEASSPWGVAMVIVGGIAFAVASIWMKRLADLDAATINGWMSLFATAPLVAYSLVLEEGQLTAIANASWHAWFAVAFQAIAIVILSYWLWYRLLRRYSVNQTMPYLLLLPIFGVLGGVVLRGEPVTWAMALGGLLTIAGVAVIILRRPKSVEQKVSAT
jgi:O-acetylserine/cysteine efflux transporter